MQIATVRSADVTARKDSLVHDAVAGTEQEIQQQNIVT